MGRGKVVLQRIENPTSRQVTFSKRRKGLMKKAYELSILCDAEVSLLIFSSSGKAYQFASHEMDRTISRYRAEVGMGLPGLTNPLSRSMEFWRREIEELKRTIDSMETRSRHFAGEGISTLGMKELKQMERQLKIGVERVRSKKRRILSEHLNSLKRQHKVLQEGNTRLQKRLHEMNEGTTSNSSIIIMDSGSCIEFQQRDLGDVCHH